MADAKSSTKKINPYRWLILETYHIHINGIVQGVGFRPMVYQLAKKMRLNGYVHNGNDGVHIYINARAPEALSFFKKIKANPPGGSKIISAELNRVADTSYPDFLIRVEEGHSSQKKVLISPDTAICPSCKTELNDIENRRYRYPFITCTVCGPRYSILESLPYERHGSSMAKFTMCESCRKEYGNIEDPRFFSQTNSCKECGIALSMYKIGSACLYNQSEVILSNIKKFFEEGKILAVKGVGGYLLLCDANNLEAIRLLRKRKERPSKPFAVLCRDLGTVRNYFELKSEESVLLKSKEAPILLLSPKEEAFKNLCMADIAPNLERIGVMLPSSPLLELIANDYQNPLIATSGNLSGSPIIHRDKDALTHLSLIADAVISYNREIIIPEDDSVIQVSRYSGQQIMLRRSRGFAPSFMQYIPQSEKTVLSTGAFLKSSFSLSVNGNVFVSQYLGTGLYYESEQMYKEVLDHWIQLYEIKPELILADLHPGYFSHQYAKTLSETYAADIKLVQHHEAHFSAVLAENDLLDTEDQVMGVIWDGTGLGRDGNIWGGEFFSYANKRIFRCYHFDYFPVITGDKMALEPRISALCACKDTWFLPDNLKEKFTGTEWNNYQALIASSNLFSSSVGRIFDAVASLLDICDVQHYEGEAAMRLQLMAESYVEINGFSMDESYFKEESHYYRIPTASLLQGIIIDLKKERPRPYIAAKFHYSLVFLIAIVANNVKSRKICFSGGVFQNSLLADWIQHEYGGKFQLFFHKNLSPNDENISFGQLVYADNQIISGEIKTTAQKDSIINHY